VSGTVHLPGSAGRPDRVAFVNLPGESQVRVRFRPPGVHAWRCDVCGRAPVPICRHARAVLESLPEMTYREDERTDD
jgi:hypothetical protein